MKPTVGMAKNQNHWPDCQGYCLGQDLPQTDAEVFGLSKYQYFTLTAKGLWLATSRVSVSPLRSCVLVGIPVRKRLACRDFGSETATTAFAFCLAPGSCHGLRPMRSHTGLLRAEGAVDTEALASHQSSRSMEKARQDVPQDSSTMSAQLHGRSIPHTRRYY